MKKGIVLFSLFIVSLSLYSAEPLVKFYLTDGSTKQYNLSEIDSLGVIDKKNNYVMRIHYDKKQIAYYPTEIIGSIKFEKDSVNKDILNVYIFGYPKTYKLSSIDSLVFYIDQWQPLTIGSQVWMLKNLNVDHYRNGDSIPELRRDTVFEYQEKGVWCYYLNSDLFGQLYGKLYNWYVVNNPKGLAPKGWHVASDEEWSILSSYLGVDSVAGGKLKETGNTHWVNPNNGATNSSGFSALPGSLRDWTGNYNFIGIGEFGHWWSSTNKDLMYAWSRLLWYGHATIYTEDYSKSIGMSVRCVKDVK